MSENYGLISDLEWARKEVAKWMYEMRNYLLDALAPDGRPFGWADQTPRERLEAYIGSPEAPGLKGNPEKWTEWILARAAEVAQLVGTLGPQAVASVHPYDVAQRMAIIYSANMERAFDREVGRVVTEVNGAR